MYLIFFQAFAEHWDAIIPMTGAIGMSIGMIIPRDGGWLPHWDEALDESTGIIEAVYFAE